MKLEDMDNHFWLYKFHIKKEWDQILDKVSNYFNWNVTCDYTYSCITDVNPFYTRLIENKYVY